MPRSMDSVQAERARSSGIAPVSLVKLTLYNSKPFVTVAKTFYLSNMAVDYDYGNTGIDQRFLPVVIGGSDFFSGISHPGQPDNQIAFGQSFDLQCNNKEINGERLIELLQAYNLEGASIEIAQMLLTKAEMDAFRIKKVLDLTGYDGDEHTVFFPGRVNRIAPITDAMLTIQCTTELPQIADPWFYNPVTPGADPRDSGKRFPRIYGIAKKVPLINYYLLDITTLAEDVPASTPGTYAISSGAGWSSSASYNVKFDGDGVGELFDCGNATATTLDVNSPGTVQSYLVGDLIHVQSDSGWIISDRPSKAVNNIYARNPSTGQIVRLDPSRYTGGINLDDTSAGGRWTTLTLTHTQLTVIGTDFGFVPGILVASGGLELYADVDGIPALRKAATWGNGHSLDGGTWEVTANAVVAVDTSDPHEGTGAQKITVDVDAESAATGIDTDDLTNWTAATGSTQALVSDEGHRDVGPTDCYEGSASGTALARCEYLDAALTADITGDLVVFDFKIKKNGYADTDDIEFRIGTTASDYWGFTFDVSEFVEDTWVTMIIDIGATGDRTITGSPDDANIDYFAVEWNRNGNGVSGSQVYVDHIMTLPFAFGVRIQNNAAGSEDFTNLQSTEQMSVAVKLGGDITEKQKSLFCRVFVDDDSGWSGTTLGANYLQYWFQTLVNKDEWKVLENFNWNLSNTAPDETDINAIQFLWLWGSMNDVYTRDPVWTLSVDAIFAADTLTPAWDVADGEALIHPADILRYLIAEVGGETYNTASYAALLTALGAAAEMGFDARAIGFTWEEQVQRVAFEARCNVFPVETPTGREWMMAGADVNYGFGAATAIIAQTHDMTDEGRAIEDLANSFSFRFAFDNSLGSSDESGYAGVALASPSGSSVPISVADIAAAETRYGPLESGPIAFRCIQDEDTALDVAGYYVQERMANNRRVFRLSGVAWFDALPYVIGDLVLIAAPWASAATNCRIISMTKAFTANTWTIVAVEVPVIGLHT